ncbi:MAG: hypothetical protein E7355_01485 [Clostridiales bacterium]|nr:hypothetical protein [Clostridiales bacterium]
MVFKQPHGNRRHIVFCDASVRL